MPQVAWNLKVSTNPKKPDFDQLTAGTAIPAPTQKSSRNFQSLTDARFDYSSADLVGRLLIFNLPHDKYRLIVRENFQGQSLFVKAVPTHDEYDRMEWMRWNKFSKSIRRSMERFFHRSGLEVSGQMRNTMLWPRKVGHPPLRQLPASPHARSFAKGHYSPAPRRCCSQNSEG
jgi:hypothetical protein